MTLAKMLVRPMGLAERWWTTLDARFALSEARVVEVGTGVTCVLILLTGPKEWYVSVFASALAAAALIFSNLRLQPTLWAFLGTAVGASALYNWESTDNHKYLLAYWCAAIMLSLGAADQRGFLAKSARSLIGVSFAMAVLWKLRSPDFVTGDFFRIELMIDKRFLAVASWVGGVPTEEVQAFRSAWTSLGTIRDVATFGGFSVELPQRMNVVAIAMTIWTLFIEVWVALAFLLPEKTLLGRFRDLPLLVFALSTYAVATVLGFGYLLLAMGLCQTRSRRARPAYIAAFILMFLFEIPVFALSQGSAGSDTSSFLGADTSGVTDLRNSDTSP
jgi:hypothetical protein